MNRRTPPFQVAPARVGLQVMPYQKTIHLKSPCGSHTVEFPETPMEEPLYPPLNTREFVAKWHNVVEKHLLTELADVLPRLAAAPRGTGLGAEQYAALAHHLAYALQVAGSSSGGVQAALTYLKEAAGSQDEIPQPS